MSLSTSHSSFWSVANKFLAVTFAVGAGLFPALCLNAGAKASYTMRQPAPLEASPKAVERASDPAPVRVAQAAVTLPALATQDAVPAGQMAAGQTVYMTVCFACHQPTGMGLPSMFPPLAGSDWVNAPKPDRIIRNVLHGVMGPININGKPFTTPAPMMPPQAAALNDAQIADVLTYVNNAWGNQGDAFSADKVKAIRNEIH